MKIILLLLLTLLIAACYQERAYRDDFKIADRCASQSDKLMKKQEFVTWCSGGSYLGTIRNATRGYYAKNYHFTKVSEARALIIEKVQQFAEPYNKEKRIRKYLQDFPFGSDNLSLWINFADNQNKPLLPPYISSVCNDDGVIFYKQYDTINKRHITIYSETFDDALKIYQKEKTTLKTKRNS